jgi:hypothetical protein
MNWENLDETLKMSEKEFEKEANRIEIVNLNARIEKWQAILHKPDLGMPALVGSEITPKRQKLSTLLHILVSTRDRKEKEWFDQNRQAQEKWRDDTLRDVLHDLRCAYGTAVNHLMYGTFTLEVPDWFKPQSTEFEIDAVSGHKVKINLKKLISPSTLQMLLDKAFSPIYLVAEQGGGYDRHGKKLGYYQSEDWETAHGTEIRYGTSFAIMRV